MKTWVCLLRGVNVGGTGKLPMADFRKLLTGLGYQDVRTYIQSGNAVFRATGSATALAADIGTAVEAAFAFRPHTFVLTLAALEAAMAKNPFRAEAEADGSRVHLMFLDAALPDGTLERLAPYATKGERAELVGDVLYLHTPEGMGRSDYAQRLGRVKVPMTGRNARTVAAVAGLARAI
jgi:uncharacterized protein (DUF1697 family)